MQRQQVVMTRKWAESNPNINFYSMHPGWADTPGMIVKQHTPHTHTRTTHRTHTHAPHTAHTHRTHTHTTHTHTTHRTHIHTHTKHTAVQEAMPGFRRRMLNRLRTPEQGADTVIWLCVAKNATAAPNGSFFEGQRSQ